MLRFWEQWLWGWRLRRIFDEWAWECFGMEIEVQTRFAIPASTVAAEPAAAAVPATDAWEEPSAFFTEAAAAEPEAAAAVDGRAFSFFHRSRATVLFSPLDWVFIDAAVETEAEAAVLTEAETAAVMAEAAQRHTAYPAPQHPAPAA